MGVGYIDIQGGQQRNTLRLILNRLLKSDGRRKRNHGKWFAQFIFLGVKTRWFVVDGMEKRAQTRSSFEFEYREYAFERKMQRRCMRFRV